MIATPTQIVRTAPHQTKPSAAMERLADIPEEEIWLAKQTSARTRRDYWLDVRHFMATLGITAALENGAQLGDKHKAAGYRDLRTTKLYDRRGYNPEKAANLFATY